MLVIKVKLLLKHLLWILDITKFVKWFEMQPNTNKSTKGVNMQRNYLFLKSSFVIICKYLGVCSILKHQFGETFDTKRWKLLPYHSVSNILTFKLYLVRWGFVHKWCIITTYELLLLKEYVDLKHTGKRKVVRWIGYPKCWKMVNVCINFFCFIVIVVIIIYILS